MSNNQQRLFWSVSRPLKYLGLTVDEWVVSLIGILPGICLINSSNIRLGFFFFLGGLFLCWSFKKYKRLAQSFKIKSFLIAKGFLKAPSQYPQMLNKEKVGR
ncbi:MAG: hypothetical protein P8P83_04850 [Rickettsiaceae bacterium]|nr:hypothetical protein [Rickettsiaceae bacterium]